MLKKIKYFVTLDKVHFLSHQWSLYNLFYKIRHINPNLYDNFRANALHENPNCNKTINIFMKLKNLNWSAIIHEKIT